MDAKKEETSQPANGEKGDSAIETAARAVGTAVGVIATTAAKIIDKPAAPEVESKPRKASRSAKASTASASASDKRADHRAANKKKKRKAHRVKLRRSSTNG